MAYQYFREWYTEAYQGDADYAYHHTFRLVALCAIEAAHNERLNIAKELQQQAHSLLSQTERNLNPNGPDRTLEKRMNSVIAQEVKRYA